MARRSVTLLAGAALAGAAGLAAARAEPAAPEKTQWKVEVSLAECTLTGVPAGPNPVQVSLLTTTGSDSYDLSLVGKAVPPTPERNLFPVTIVFAGGGQRFTRNGRGARIDRELGNAIVVGGLGRDVVDAFAHASGIGLEGKYAVRPAALTHVQAAMEALDGCVRDQLVEWGADPAQFAPGGSRPVALIPRDDWLSKKDWDRIVPKTDGAVDAMFRVAVAADGSIDGCAPVGRPPSARVEQIACDAVLARRLFTPASDPAGKPVRGVATFQVQVRVVTGITGTAI